ncbi:Pentatricopeptide repeat-containing protein [Drosera capensis]
MPHVNSNPRTKVQSLLSSKFHAKPSPAQPFIVGQTLEANTQQPFFVHETHSYVAGDTLSSNVANATHLRRRSLVLLSGRLGYGCGATTPMLIRHLINVRNLIQSSTHQRRGFSQYIAPNQVSKYFARAKLIDTIRLGLHSSSPDALISVLENSKLDSFVITNAIRAAPSPDSALTLVKNLERSPYFSHTKHSVHAIAKVLARSRRSNELRELIGAINEGEFRKVGKASFMERMHWYALAQDWDSVLCVWDELQKQPDRPCTEAYNIVMDLYAKKGQDLDAVHTFYRIIERGGKKEAAKEVFNVLPSMRVKRTSKQYSVLVDAFSTSKQFDVVKSLLNEMQIEGALPKRSILSSLQAMQESGFLEETSELVAMMMPDDRIQKIEFCMDDGEDEGEDEDDNGDHHRDCAISQVQLKPWLDPNALAVALGQWTPEEVSALEDAKIVWTSRLVCKMIRGFKSAETAWHFFCWVAYQPEFVHDVHTLSRMITKLARSGNFGVVDQLISKMKRDKMKLAFDTARLMIDFYGLSKNGDAALKVFREVKVLCAPISEFNMLLLYSSLLRALTKCDMSSDVMAILDEMFSSGIHPDIQTFTGLMHYFATKGDFRTVQKLFAMVRQSGVQPDGYLYKILIRAYCKSERAPLALRLFEDMRNSKLSPDLPTKSLLVKSLWKEGKLREAAMVEERCEEISDALSLALPGHLFTISSRDLTKRGLVDDKWGGGGIISSTVEVQFNVSVEQSLHLLRTEVRSTPALRICFGWIKSSDIVTFENRQSPSSEDADHGPAVQFHMVARGVLSGIDDSMTSVLHHKHMGFF